MRSEASATLQAPGQLETADFYDNTDCDAVHCTRAPTAEQCAHYNSNRRYIRTAHLNDAFKQYYRALTALTIAITIVIRTPLFGISKFMRNGFGNYTQLIMSFLMLFARRAHLRGGGYLYPGM